MRRKLIKQGAGGITISLPKKWANTHHLQPGEEIDVEEHEDGLLILPLSRKKEKKLEITIDENQPARLRTIIASAYRRGYDEITLTSKQNFSFVEINKVVDSLTGYVITHQTSKNLTIKSLIAEDKEDIPTMLNKFCLTISFFITETAEFLSQDCKAKKQITKEELKELAKSIMRMRDYCQRMIHITTYGGDKSYEYNTLVFIAEKIAGNIKAIINLQEKIKKNQIKEIKKFLKETNTLFSELRKTLMKKDLKSAIEYNKKITKRKKEHYLDQNLALTTVIAENLFSLSSRIISILL